ncbi:MAG: fibronectin type III domain-containing protein [Clostridiales bacterium]|nr:fibronectin type III domain-containing protein [Clostridiales bacterium]
MKNGNWKKYFLLLAAATFMSFIPITATQAAGIPSDAGTYNGHYYYVYPSGTVSTYEEAENYCKALGGHLATISSAKENSFLYSYIVSCGYTSAFFGYSDAETEGVWKWCTSESISYTNWHSGEPSSGNSSEDYAKFYWKYTDGSWNDSDFRWSALNDEGAFICEWDYELKLSDTKLVLDSGDSVYVTYAVTLGGKTVSASATWKSSDTSVAKVSSKGKIVAVGAGTCKITCKAKGVSKSIRIIVNPKKVSSISTLSKTKTKVQLKWKAQSGVTKYVIYMYDKDLEEYTVVKSVNGSLNSATISGLKKGTTYKFKIRAYVKYNSKKYYGAYSTVYKVTTKK